jgi:hypothetical protein
MSKVNPTPQNVDLSVKEDELELPPLLIRLTTDAGKLPSGLIYALPRFEAERLIMRRLATAVGTLGILPDLTLSEEELAEAGIT